MSKLYVPPALSAKQYLNLATINGMDIGTGTPIYENGTAIRDWTYKNDLTLVRAFDANAVAQNQNGFALEFTNFGSKFTFQLSDPAVMFFEVLTVLNPPGTTYAWTSSREYLDITLYQPGYTYYASSRVWHPSATNQAAGPFTSQFAVQLPVGESNFYLLAWFANFTSTQTGHRHIGVRVNLMGYLL